MDMDGISAAADSLAKEFAEQKVLLEREMRLREVLKVRVALNEKKLAEIKIENARIESACLQSVSDCEALALEIKEHLDEIEQKTQAIATQRSLQRRDEELKNRQRGYAVLQEKIRMHAQERLKTSQKLACESAAVATAQARLDQTRSLFALLPQKAQQSLEDDISTLDACVMLLVDEKSDLERQTAFLKTECATLFQKLKSRR